MSATETRPSSLAGMAAAAAPARDRFVDLLRASSIAVVVLGHWLMAVVVWKDGSVGAANALEVVDGVWLLTWVLQVMPIFFFVGGFANAVAWDSIRRRGEGYGELMRSRLVRLLRPTVVFAAAGLAVFAAMRAAGAGGAAFDLAAQLVAKPLWFLAVYVLVIAIAPAMLTLHRRFGVRALTALVGGAVLVDMLRVGFDVPVVGGLNYALVWLIPHQLGFFYADGSLPRVSRRALAGVAAASLGVLVALTASGIYSASMVGVASDRVSNNSPPSVCLVALTFWLVSLAMLARPRVTRWLRGARAWTAVVAANSMIMTVFLWHLGAMMIAAAVVLPGGFPQPRPGTVAWWLLRPAWILAATSVLAPFVAALGRVERKALLSRRDGPGLGAARAAAATAATVLGLAALATWGFSGNPAFGAGSTALAAVALLLCGRSSDLTRS